MLRFPVLPTTAPFCACCGSRPGERLGHLGGAYDCDLVCKACYRAGWRATAWRAAAIVLGGAWVGFFSAALVVGLR